MLKYKELQELFGKEMFPDETSMDSNDSFNLSSDTGSTHFLNTDSMVDNDSLLELLLTDALTLDSLYSQIEHGMPEMALRSAHMFSSQELNETPIDTQFRDPIIITAVQAGYTALVDLLINKPGFNYAVTDVNGYNAMHHAVYHEQIEIVDLLLTNPMTRDTLLNQQANNGLTPLDIAQEKQNHPITLALVNATLYCMQAQQQTSLQKAQEQLVSFSQRLNAAESSYNVYKQTYKKDFG